MDVDSETEDQVCEDDFYAFLNIPKKATKDEINGAYRRLSKIYHPDKHLDPDQKLKAEKLFNKTKKAYEILSDPHLRAIYDSLGIKGLETEGWEIVQRTKTPAEIRSEYEQLAEERAERLKQQRTNPHGTVTININATDLFNPYNDALLGFENEMSTSVIPNIEVSAMNFSQSVEFPLTQTDMCMLSGQLQTQNGTGAGGINLNWRHIFSHKSWAEVEVAAVQRPHHKLMHEQKPFKFSIIQLSLPTTGNGPVLSLRGFRTLTKRFFWNGGTVLQFTPQGVRPGFMSNLAMQVDKHTVAYLTYHGGIRSFASTSVMKDTEYYQYNLSMQVGLPHSFVSISYTRKMLNNELKLRILLKAGSFGSLIEYGVEKKVSKYSFLAAAMSVGLPTGVKLKIRITRGNQTYSFPIHLCEELMPSAIFYGTIFPLAVYVIVKKGFVDPFLKQQRARKVEIQKQNNYTKLIEKRREAQAAQELMASTYSRIKDEEVGKNGLVIVKALYGKILSDYNAHGEITSEELLDVTIPIQCLVKNSKLELHSMSKSHLPGFFDPALGEDKELLIIYNFHQHPHEVTIKDNEPLRIPKPTHKVNAT